MAAMEVLRYLVSTPELRTGYRKKLQVQLRRYSDADYAGDKSGLRFTFRVIYTINDSPLR